MVCACSGHLLELMEPGEVDESLGKWELETLPIAFKPWDKRPSDQAAKKKIAAIREELDVATEIYHCGDADDEGQLIVDEVLEHLGKNPSDDNVWRVYVNDNLPENIRRAFEKPKPNRLCVGDGRAAHARQLADICFGINESRLATVKLGAKFTVGRVQTPTLGLVIERDLARENHVKREYHELRVEMDCGGQRIAFKYKPPEDWMEDGKHCFDKSRLEGVAEGLAGKRASFEIRHTVKRSPAPLPFEMTSLTGDMSKRHGLTAKDVMEATQSLRDNHKAITYNRTDSPYLKLEHFEHAPVLVPLVKKNIGVDCTCSFDKPGRAFDDSKVSAHHGIIPQEVRINLEGLSDRERNVYEAVALRYLVQFMKPLTYTESKAHASCDGVDGVLEHKERWRLDDGWLAIAPAAWSSVTPKDGQPPKEGRYEGVVVKAEIVSKETTPPPAFTDGTLMAAMANVARYVKDPEVKRILLEKDAGSANEHGSIGTVATRKDIIDGLVEHGYLERKGKGKSLVSTEKARAFWSLIPEQIKGVDLTARWWLAQQKVAAGEAGEYTIMESVCEEFSAHKESAYEGVTLRPNVGTCPLCGKNVLVRGSVYSCESNTAEKQKDGTWKKTGGCGFAFSGFGGKKFTNSQAANLLSGGKVSLSGCKGKKKDGTPTTYSCKVSIDRSTGKFDVEFPQKGKGAQSGGKRSKRSGGYRGKRSGSRRL